MEALCLLVKPGHNSFCRRLSNQAEWSKESAEDLETGKPSSGVSMLVNGKSAGFGVRQICVGGQIRPLNMLAG